MRTLDLKKVRAFAEKAHEGQERKYTGDAYIVHPLSVARLVRNVGGTTEMIAAAMLHDTVEDCDVTLADIEREFGTVVAYYVEGLTDVSKPEDGNRATRKEMDRQHTAQAPAEVKTIKLADLIDNSHSITQHDPNFAKVYMKEKALLLEVLTEGNPVLLSIAKRIVDTFNSK